MDMITTARLTVGPLRAEETGAVMRLLADSRIRQTYMIPDHDTVEAYRPLAQRFISLSAEPERFVRGIYLGAQLIGWVNDTGIDGGMIELGYVIDPAYQRQGYATEMLRAVIARLLSGSYHCVRTEAFEENGPSIAVMRGAGMTQVETDACIEYRGQTHRLVRYECRREAVQ